MSATPALSTVVGQLRAAGCVFAEDEAALLIAAAGTPADLAAMVRRRVDGLPLEQILGWAEFRGLRVVVAPGVFVPRRRTGALIEEALALAPPPPGHAVVLDLCCGTGALGLAFATALPAPDRLEVYAADLDPVAVDCARRNLAPVGGHVYLGDMYEPLPPALRGRVDVLLANAPYVPTAAIGTLPPEARDHERRAALDGGPDGLTVIRRVMAGAAPWLRPGGHLLVETSRRQAPYAVQAAVGCGLHARHVTADELGSTVVIASRPGETGRESAC
jgi:release factor glutamine methyltransferase